MLASLLEQTAVSQHGGFWLIEILILELFSFLFFSGTNGFYRIHKWIHLHIWQNKKLWSTLNAGRCLFYRGFEDFGNFGNFGFLRVSVEIKLCSSWLINIWYSGKHLSMRHHLSWPDIFLGNTSCGKIPWVQISLVDFMTSVKPGALAQSNVLAYTKNISDTN